MPLPILIPDDFVGVNELKFNNTDKILSYIYKYERDYILRLLNASAYMSIKDDDPIPDKFNDLINGGLTYEDSNGDVCYLVGLKEILAGFIYYNFIADNFSTSTSGKIRLAGENSENLSAGEVKQIAYSRYNDAAKLWNESARKFIIENQYLASIVELSNGVGGGLYQLTLDSIKYIVDGQEAEINGENYTVSIFDSENKIIQIDAGVDGIDFTDENVNYDVFKDYNLPIIEPLWL